MYVGGGIVNSGAAEALLAFAEEFQLPVTPTLMGLGGFPSSTSALSEHAGNARHLCGEHGGS